MLKNWFKVYVYNSKKHKVYFALTVLCLAIGIVSLLLSVLYFKEEYSFDQWNENKDNIYFVEKKSGGKVALSGHPFALSKRLKEDYKLIEAYLLYGYYQSEEVVYKGKHIDLEKVIHTNEQFFDFFPYPLLYGSKQHIFTKPKEVVLEQKESELLFGKGVNPIGELVQVKEEFYTVSGVYRLENHRSSFMPEMIINTYQFITPEDLNNWDALKASLLVKTSHPKETAQAIDSLYLKHYFTPMASKSNVSLEELLKTMEGILAFKTILHQLPKLHFQKDAAIVGAIPEPIANVKLLYIIVGLSAVMLLLSVFNYVNLSLSQILSRAKEVGVRKVLGGVKGTIMRQSLFETSLTVCFSFLLSVLIFFGILPSANSYLNTNIVTHWTDFVLLFMGIYVLILLMAGLIPAFYIAHYKVLRVLKGDFCRSQSGSIIKYIFLIIQFTIACWFITGSNIVNKQAKFMITKDLGFEGDQILSLPFLEGAYDDSKVKKYEVFKNEIKKIKGVEEVAVSSLDFGENTGVFTIKFFTHKDKQNLMALLINAEAPYFDMMRMQLKEGRLLNASFANDSIQNILINESLLEVMGETSITDLKIGDFQIVGLIQDFHNGGLENKIYPMMFKLPTLDHNFFNQVTLRVDLEQLESILPALEKLWYKFHPESKKAFTYQFVNKKFAQTFEKINTQKKVLSLLSVLVSFIALFGLFAVSSFNIGTKLREIAIRRVLGANSNELILKLSYHYVMYCIIGFGLSVFPSYYLLNKWLSAYAYRIEIGYEVYLVCFVLIMSLTLCIVVSRAYKATRINVLQYIKYE